MKTYKHLWEELISDENIIAAAYSASHGTIRGRFIDFMGFRFYRTHTTMRRGITKKAMRKALKLSHKTYITVYDARQMLTYYGWIKHTDSHDFKLRHIDPYVDFTKLKSIISEKSKVKHG